MLQKKSPQIVIEFLDNEVSEMFSIYICILYFTWCKLLIKNLIFLRNSEIGITHESS